MIHKSRLWLALTLTAFASAAPALAQGRGEPNPVSIHCPDPSTIVYTSIPSSIHGFYTAESDSVGFWAMDISVLKPDSMALAVAEVSAINDYWSLYCVYESQGLVLNMGTNPSKVFQDCHFPDGTQRCIGTRDDCVLSCPELP